MSSHRKHHRPKDTNLAYPVKLIFDEDLTYFPVESTENNSDKNSSNSSDNEYNTLSELKIKKHTTTSEVKHDSQHKNIHPQVLNSKVLSECKNHFTLTEIDPSLIPIKAPVIVSYAKVYINIENKVKLNSYATSIKQINKKVFLKQCTLIPKAKKLFLSGTIKKSIEYSELNSRNNSLDGRIKNIIVHVSFNCVTDVQYIVNPEIEEKNLKALVTISKPGVREETLSEVYNQVAPVYCEIVTVDFKELNIKEDIKPYICKVPDIYTFKTISQKMVMYLTIRLIQNQRIFLKNPL